MPRQLRIEYPDAYYHIMARGDRCESIFRDDEDRRFFLHALGQACQRTGWQVLAWVLMNNHYHLVLHTPKPNLVAGMKWLQNTYTRRFNVRHRLWGHLFGGRYKSIVVQDGDYLGAVVDYVHLNPVRARLVETQDGLESYPWSSLNSILLPPGKRPLWLDGTGALNLAQMAESAGGRRKYVERLEAAVDWRKAKGAGLWHPEGGSLHRALRRGWCFGAEAFREKLLKIAGKFTVKNANYRSSPLGREHGESAAEALLAAGLKHHGLKLKEVQKLKGGDIKKQELAWALARNTTVPQAWIAERLGYGSNSYVSHEAARYDKRLGGSGKPSVRYPEWVTKFKNH